MSLNPELERITARIAARSAPTRAAYLARIARAASQAPQRGQLSCTNLAHGFAASPAQDKLAIRVARQPNLAIVTAYNDMLSAHVPYADYPAQIKAAARDAGATAQVAGGVPAMCDGITQGQPGMELSLFSRDVIAMSTAIALSHGMFDAALYLGVCDKIVPGLLIGALHFGHLPAVFVPAGPMATGIANGEKSRVRQLYAEGKVSRETLLEAEAQAYHGRGTCTFYGTANSNQMLLEVMGLHLPGAAFVPPDTPLREALTAAATRQAVALAAPGDGRLPIGRLVDERCIANAIVGLLATGGSTNHTMHLVAIARAAGIRINWDDFSELSAVVPLIARVYPNGQADVNQFHAAGGMAWVIGELLAAGLLHPDVATVAAGGLAAYAREPLLHNNRVVWRDAPATSADDTILRPATAPFSADGGLKLLQGRLGRAVIKTSAVQPAQRRIEAPARVFHSQAALKAAFERGELGCDFVAVLPHQGPRANGMPELHALTPILGVLQDRGHRVALVTDGRMSGASGKVPAAIHVTPEAAAGGAIGRVRDGDPMLLDADAGVLQILVDETELAARTAEAMPEAGADEADWGRGLFDLFRAGVLGAEDGAVSAGASSARNQGEQ